MTTSLNQFEVRLLEIERRVRASASFADVFQAAVAALRELADVSGCAAWISSADGPVRLAVYGSSEHDPESWRRAVADLLQADPIATSCAARELQPGAEGQVVLAPVRLTASQFAALEVRLTADESVDPFLQEATAAVTDCLGDVFRNSLLDDFQQRLQMHAGLLNLTHGLYECDSRDAFAVTTVTETRTLLNVDRVSLVWQDIDRWILVAASGVDTVDPDSPAGRAIAAATQRIVSANVADQWLSVRSNDASLPATVSAELRPLAAGGTEQLRVIPLQLSSSSTAQPDRLPAAACLVLELFSAGPRPADSTLALVQQQISQLASRPEVSRPTWRTRLRSRRSLVAGGLLLAALALLIVPADFELEVTGQLFPEDRYRVFSPHDGIIEQLNVAHESPVQTGQSLVTVRNPDLDLQLQQTAGHLDTERVRLTAVQRSRLVSPTTAAALSPEQVLGGEAAVRQRIDDLQERLDLLTAQRESLTVQARTDGTVYRANLQEELLSRPVQRGDFLFEVIPDQADWYLELHVPDDVTGYLQQARSTYTEQLPIRFFLRMSPGKTWRTELDSLDRTVEILDGQLICRGTADAADMQTQQLRPGTSVTARIDCGQRSLGFVVFRELIEFIREQTFAWF